MDRWRHLVDALMGEPHRVCESQPAARRVRALDLEQRRRELAGEVFDDDDSPDLQPSRARGAP